MSDEFKETWRRACGGDPKAWRSIVMQYQSLVYTIAIRTGLSTAEAADCFQHTWLALYENREKVQDIQRLPGWLATTARREAIRISRLRKRSSNLEEAAEVESKVLLPDQEMEQLERQFYLESAIRRLDSRCSGLVHAFFFDDEEVSYEQLAANLGLSINAIGPLRQRCLKKLRELLLELGYGDARIDDNEPLTDSDKRTTGKKGTRK